MKLFRGRTMRKMRRKISLLPKHIVSEGSIHGTPPPEAMPTVRMLMLANVAPNESTAWRLLCEHNDLGWEEIIQKYTRRRTRRFSARKVLKRVREILF